MSTSTKGTMMATATQTESHPWAAANVNQPREKRKWGPALQKQLVAAVKRADKAGLPRQAVFDELAVKFTEKRGEEFTSKQVSSQFHLVKRRFGYEVDRQEQVRGGAPARKLLAMPTASQLARNPERALAKLEARMEQALATSVAALEAETERANAAEAREKEARRELAKVKRRLAKIAS